MARPILILKAGTTLPAVRDNVGDFDEWFERGIGAAKGRTVVVDPQAGERPGAPSDYAGLVVTGSPSSMRIDEPWYADGLAFLRRAVEIDLPTLAVCFGHQMLAVALGGRVDRNPRGREIGTVQVLLTDAGVADALFAGLPRVVSVQATHEDVVTELPAGAELLASNEQCPVQAFAIGRSVRAVQWHPEFSLRVIRGYIEARAAVLEDEGVDPEALWVQADETDSGARILENFRRSFVERTDR